MGAPYVYVGPPAGCPPYVPAMGPPDGAVPGAVLGAVRMPAGGPVAEEGAPAVGPDPACPVGVMVGPAGLAPTCGGLAPCNGLPVVGDPKVGEIPDPACPLGVMEGPAGLIPTCGGLAPCDGLPNGPAPADPLLAPGDSAGNPVPAGDPFPDEKLVPWLVVGAVEDEGLPNGGPELGLVFVESGDCPGVVGEVPAPAPEGRIAEGAPGAGSPMGAVGGLKGPCWTIPGAGPGAGTGSGAGPGTIIQACQ